MLESSTKKGDTNLDEQKEKIDADHSLDTSGGDDLPTRADMLRMAKSAQDAFVRVWLAEISAKEDFLRIPAFEKKVQENGEVIRKPNKALREMFAEAWALRNPKDKAEARRILQEMEATADFFQTFTWKNVKGAPKITKLDLKLRKKLENQPMAREAVQLYDPVEVAFHKADEQARLTADMLMTEPDRMTGKPVQMLNRAAINSLRDAAYNSALDVEYRDALDTDLPRYPDLDGRNAVKEALDIVDDLRSWGSWTRESSRFCEWIRRRGGVHKLGDLTDNLGYLSRKAPEAQGKPVILIRKVEVYRMYPSGIELPNHPKKTPEGWGWLSKRGFYRMNLRWHLKHLGKILKRAACDEETVPVFPKRAKVKLSGAEKRSVIRVVPINVEGMCKTSMRIASCSCCAGRIEEVGDAYWSLISNMGVKMPVKRRVFCTQFRSSGAFGAFTLFVKDDLNMTALQRRLLGDALFESEDTWKIEGKTGEYRCVLCGRTKFFRTRQGVAEFTRRKYLQDFTDNNGTPWFVKGTSVLCTERVVITFDVAGEQFSKDFGNRFVQP